MPVMKIKSGDSVEKRVASIVKLLETESTVTLEGSPGSNQKLVAIVEQVKQNFPRFHQYNKLLDQTGPIPALHVILAKEHEKALIEQGWTAN